MVRARTASAAIKRDTPSFEVGGACHGQRREVRDTKGNEGWVSVDTRKFPEAGQKGALFFEKVQPPQHTSFLCTQSQ